MFETRTILSQQGPHQHQGDSLGPLLFCLSIHQHLLRLKSELVAGFMDDLTLGGPEETVAANVDYLKRQEESTGLIINASKCKVISRGPTPLEVPFEGFTQLKPDEAELLDAPLLNGPKMDELLSWPTDALN